ncbi:YggS family pyridoxal phosphate-dependent enzyme [Citricoccus sp. SGAir0253]|uniref:YggS family pyridoxal phosphate-dependent enzyme n=1 Tax=Citricoccus sp. SGAir0253 TaxID=2567881 RepID=UPI0010CCE65D|nr:YggS family pyridoxal phosphate-dependent enzyme [Citricoccus sp. SGAir0253]QCU77843.1 YggS family pyridoxal phosphate-dependent enzyme [Citricoccus sp. SGAir0253]
MTGPAGAVPAADDERGRELAARLAAVRERIAAATAAAGREDVPELVVVTKFHPAEDVLRLAALGVRDVGENRDQEARAKAAATAGALAGTPLRWHFIGQLQSNKAKYVVRYAAAVHSVDRGSLVDALSAAMVREQERRRRAGEDGREPLDCLVQVDLDDRPEAERPSGIGARGGAAPAEVPALAERIAAAEGLRLRGVMAVAPLGLDPVPAFRRLAGIAADLAGRYPGATWVSAGMSQDLEQAVAAGATHLRVGTDVLGPRPPVG